jgi:hypothetical protein
MSSLAAANVDLMLCKVRKSRLGKMERVFEKHYNMAEENRSVCSSLKAIAALLDLASMYEVGSPITN